MKLVDLPTPALIADNGIIDQNMLCISELLKGKNIRLRPHFKSHKCAELAHRQTASGAVGMTCAKLSEAEDLIFSGINDVLIANQIVESAKIVRLAQLAGMCRLTVCIDDEDNAKALSRAAVSIGSTIHCLAEYDIGMNRCGVRTADEYLHLAQVISRLPGLAYDGIQAYAGYASHVIDVDERKRMTRLNEQKVAALAESLRNNGIPVSVISGGSTGTAALKAEGGVYTELQAGSYLFMDSTYSKLGLPFRNALSVLASVVSRHGDTVIFDVGVKGLGADQDDPVIMTAEGLTLSGECELHEEHLLLHGYDSDIAVGEKVFVIPGHCCSTVNLYDRIYLYTGDTIEDRLTVTARGKSQ